MRMERSNVPTILLINDDGIQSIGLIALRKQLKKLGEVIIAAPKNEQSGMGKALTASASIKVMKTMLSDGSEAHAVTGTPADAYFMAVHKIMRRKPDLLVAGINLGPNLGIDDLLNSGTLGAALEAAIHGVPSTAVSYCIKEINERRGKTEVALEELEPTAILAQKASKYVLEEGMPRGVDIISINVPEKADLKKIKVTQLSYRGYSDIYIEQKIGYRIRSWSLTIYPHDEPGTDVHAIKEERSISVTPIKISFPHNKEELEELAKALIAQTV
jgi:5'-nucleotidase